MNCQLYYRQRGSVALRISGCKNIPIVYLLSSLTVLSFGLFLPTILTFAPAFPTMNGMITLPNNWDYPGNAAPNSTGFRPSWSGSY